MRLLLVNQLRQTTMTKIGILLPQPLRLLHVEGLLLLLRAPLLLPPATTQPSNRGKPKKSANDRKKSANDRKKNASARKRKSASAEQTKKESKPKPLPVPLPTPREKLKKKPQPRQPPLQSGTPTKLKPNTTRAKGTMKAKDTTKAKGITKAKGTMKATMNQGTMKATARVRDTPKPRDIKNLPAATKPLLKGSGPLPSMIMLLKQMAISVSTPTTKFGSPMLLILPVGGLGNVMVKLVHSLPLILIKHHNKEIKIIHIINIIELVFIYFIFRFSNYKK